jgi:uncharacterized protein (DUF302 family)
MMYFFSKSLRSSFAEAEKRTREALQKEGFGVIMEIDFREKFREKLNVEFKPYKILGACSPAHAYRAMQAEDKIGLMMPCNVLIEEASPGEIEVALIDPMASMMAVENEGLRSTAEEIRARLKKVVDSL